MYRKLSLDSEQASRYRLAGLGLTAVLLAAMFALGSQAGWHGSIDLHTALEATAIVPGLCAAFLVLGTGRSMVDLGEPDDIFRLIVGAGITGAVILDCYHMLASSPWLIHLMPSDPESLIPWSWTQSRLFLAVALVLALAARRRSSRLPDAHGISPALVYAGMLGMTLICILYLSLIPLPPAYYPDLAMPRPQEIVSGILFIAAFVYMFNKGDWRHDTFEFWLLMSVLVNIVVQCLFIPFSNTLFDFNSDASHLLNIVSYLFVLTGIASSALQQDRRKHAGDGGAVKKAGNSYSGSIQSLQVQAQTLKPGIVGKRLLLLIGSVGIMIITSMIVSQETQLKRQLTHSMLNSLNEIASAKKQALQSRMTDYLALLRVIGSNPDLRKQLAEHQRTSTGDTRRSTLVALMEHALQEALSAETPLRNISIYGIEGNVLASAGNIWLAETDAESIVIPESDYITGMREIGGMRYLQLAGPLYYQDQLVGGIQVWIDSQSIVEMLGGMKALGDSAEAVLACRGPDGRVSVMRSRADLHFHEFPGSPGHSEVDKYPMMYALGGVEKVFEHDMIDYTGSGILAASRYLPEAGLGLVVKITRSEINDLVYDDLRYSLMLGAIVLIFALLVGWIASFMLISPLHRITAFARNFSNEVDVSGLGASNRLPVNTDDEFGVLASTLLHAANDIRMREQTVTSLEKRMHAVLDNMLDTVLLVDMSGTIQYSNRAAVGLLGYDSQELLHASISMLLSERFREDHYSLLNRYINTDEPLVMGGGRELTALHRNGVEIPVSIAISRIDVGGEVLYASILHDLTESKQFENVLKSQNRELAAANEELEQFAYVASHDLKTPLRAIENLVEWISDDMEGIEVPAEVKRNLQRLDERARFMEQMIRELLSFSRAGRYAYPAETVDVKQLVQQIVFEQAPPPGIQVVIDESLPVLDTPKPPLELVLRNLISNAIKYHDSDQGIIEVSAEEGEHAVLFRVSDDGPGIDPGFHKKVFQIFQTLQPKSQTQSTGMGLALVKRVVEGYGHTIELESYDGERGCTFRFGWPLRWESKTGLDDHANHDTTSPTMTTRENEDAA